MIRENWRIVLMVVLLVGSAAALFAPSGASADGNATTAAGPTNLQYGLELSGGTRVRAPLVGMTATGVPVSPTDENAVETNVSQRLDLSLSDVQVRPQLQTVEVFSQNVTREQVAEALRAEGYDVQASDVENRVTEPTRQTAVQVLNQKINKGGLTGGSATISRSATDDRAFILVEVPNANREEVLELISSRGQVEIVAGFPTENGTYRRVPLISQNDLASIGTATQPQRGPPYVPATLTQPAAQRFAEAMREFGFTSDRGIENCRWQADEENYGYCLFTVVDGEIVYASSMGSGLAEIINNGQFVADPGFRMTASSMEEARELQVNLRAGALPTNLAIQGQGTTYFLEPSLAQEFKTFSLVTGFIAVLAVALTVFIRYREPGVALPMILTAGAEVFLLLGFAASVGLALDLSHIAGFIAVIGTGVDDLIIIADEILQQGEVRTGKVFASRFRKAFWVIGAAAATTIIAMSPLAVLSLGDLQGFAIITIVGVLLGVLVTRPAYGNILRNLVLDE
ncbi:preprotein translocase subunit SecD [Natronomonas sp. EA1]|uniref:preprotein translocase subunit SecD n=1 Tax=Natronomonas sp. EA1 TaxID=3421655 RepID=UPI003EBA0E55